MPLKQCCLWNKAWRHPGQKTTFHVLDLFSFPSYFFYFFFNENKLVVGGGVLIATNSALSSSHLLANPSSALPFAKTKLPNQNTIDPLPSNMYLHNNNNPLENVLITSFLLFVHNRFISLTLQSRHREPRTPHPPVPLYS